MSVHFDLEKFSSAFGSAGGSQYNTALKRTIFFDGKALEVSRHANLSEAILAYAGSHAQKGDYVGSETYVQKNSDAVENFLRQNPKTSIENLAAAIQSALLAQQAIRNGRSLATVWDSLAVSKTSQTLKILESTWYQGEDLVTAIKKSSVNPVLSA